MLYGPDDKPIRPLISMVSLALFEQALHQFRDYDQEFRQPMLVDPQGNYVGSAQGPKIGTTINVRKPEKYR